MLNPTNNKALFFFPTIIIGFLDLVTTVVGIAFFSAAEVNPLFSSLTQTNMEIYIGIKSSTILLTGFLFYKGACIAERSVGSSRLGLHSLKICYLLSLVFLIMVVANNILVIFQLA